MSSLAASLRRNAACTVFLLIAACGGGGGGNDDGGRPPSLTVSISNEITASEDGSAQFVVSLSRASGSAIRVDYETRDGSARAGEDFSHASGDVRIAAGQTSASVEIDIIDDSMDEPDEDFFLAVTNVSEGSVPTQLARAVITDDDAAPTVSVHSVTAEEDDGGNATVVAVPVSLSSASGFTISVDYATSDQSATAGTDYEQASGTLTFEPGETSRTVSITLLPDSIDEPLESLSVELSNPSAVTIATAGTVQILDNDGAPLLTIQEAQVLEGDSGTVALEFVAELSSESSRTVTADWSTIDGSATAGADYLAASGTLELAAGQTSGTIVVDVFGDIESESDESLLLQLSGVNFATPVASSITGTIIDDDRVDTLPTLSIFGAAGEEGDDVGSTLTLTVELSAASTDDVTFSYSTTDGSALAGEDYVAGSGQVVIPAGRLAGTVPVDIIPDELDELSESFLVIISSPVNASIAGGSATATINDDDPPPGVSVFNASGQEVNSGQSSIMFDVELSEVSGLSASVDYATADGTSEAGADYESTVGRLTFAPGQTSKNVSVPILGDEVFEGAEEFSLILSNATNASIVAGSAVGTIVDNEQLPVIGVSSAQVTEGGSGTTLLVFDVELSNASNQAVSVTYVTEDGTATAGADYVAASGTLLIPAGERQASISVSVNGDELDELNETFSIQLSNPAGGSISGSGLATGTIEDDDAPTAIRINVIDGEITESDTGDVTANLAVELTAPSGLTVSVDYTTTDITASASDYTATAGTLTFQPGDLSKAFSVAVTGDLLDEANETFAVSLSNAINGNVVNGTGIVTIMDDDPLPELTLAGSSPQQSESGSTPIVFDVTLTPVSGRAVTVDYGTSDVSAIAGQDYTGTSGRLTIDPGTTSVAIVVPLLQDPLDENDELLSVTLSNASNATIAVATATGTIVDDDPLPSISLEDWIVAEGDSGSTNSSLTAVLTPVSGRPVSATFSSNDGSASAGTDYAAVSGIVTIPAGAPGAFIDLEIFGDTEDEDDETFTVTLSNPVDGTIAKGTGEVTIQNDDGTPTSGLDARPLNLTCTAPPRPTGGASIAANHVYQGVGDFTQPLQLLKRPDSTAEWYVVQQNGIIYRFDDSPTASARATVADLSGLVDSSLEEAGLLGMAFHPAFDQNGYVYLSYTATGADPVSNPLVSRISRFLSNDGGATIDLASEVVLLSLEQRYENHNGGNIAFGPDGYLYAGFGDSGDAGDPEGRAQNNGTLHGSMIRIDVNSSAPYSVPSDNPFSAGPLCDVGEIGNDSATPCPEILAWGLRNPWRWSFDSATGALWLADVGQFSREEINRIEPGGNYGWNIQEGFACFNPPSGCDTTGLVQPLVEYAHSENRGRSVTGGYVYRGSSIPELIGRYVFGDFTSGFIMATTTDTEGRYGIETLQDTNLLVASFGQDESGEIFVVHYSPGRIYKLEPAGMPVPDTIPDQLEDTGCVDSTDISKPASGMIPYRTIAPFWSDGAVKERHYSLPEGTTVDVDIDGDWLFPIGSVIMKSFDFGGKRIETRLFMRHPDGEWAGYTYEWNDTETAATRVIGGKTRDLGGQTWIYPSGAQCMECHTSVAGFSLGLEHLQLNNNITYPSTGRTANQLFTADAIDVLTDDLVDVGAIPSLVDPLGNGAPVEDRARAYLHTNCSQCHRPAGPTPATMDLRWGTPFGATNTCNVSPITGDLGFPDPRIIEPGNASNSLLINRINRRDVHGMPPLGSNVVDLDGVQLLSNWIDGLAACP